MTVDLWLGTNGKWEDEFHWSAGVPNSTSDVGIVGATAFTVTLNSAATIDSLVMGGSARFSESAKGSLDIAGTFEIISGTALLRSANTIGEIEQAGGSLEIFNDGALGAGIYRMDGGNLIAAADVSFTNQLLMSGNVTFAAAHGHVLTENASSWSFAGTPGSSITFGDNSHDGTVVWESSASGFSFPSEIAVVVRAGTLTAVNSSLSALLTSTGRTEVDAGARIDIGAQKTIIGVLEGRGEVTSETAAVLQTGNSEFDGTITGHIALDVNGNALVLTGKNTFDGNTTIEAGATLQLGDGANRGSVRGTILDNGNLVYDQGGAHAVNAISGTGGVVYEGGGVFTIKTANTYAGGTLIDGASVVTRVAGAFGSAPLTIQDATITAAADMTLTTDLISQDATTIAAAHGVTMEIAPSDPWLLAPNGNLLVVKFGTAQDDGTVVLGGSGISFVGPELIVDVAGGTVRGDGIDLAALMESSSQFKIESGATVDLGSSDTVVELTGSGTLTSSASLQMHNASFAGTIEGDAAVEILSNSILTGNNTYTGGTLIDSGSALSLGNGGNAGSVKGAIVNNGALFFDHKGIHTIANAISGAGEVVYEGSGTHIVDRVETYTGATVLASGTLSIGRAGAIGTGPLTVAGGELLATNNVTLSQAFRGEGSFTFAAAHGSKLSLHFATADFDLNHIAFGDATDTGPIALNMGPTNVENLSNYTVEVATHSLKLGSPGASSLLAFASSVTIDADAAINMNDSVLNVQNLKGSGTIDNAGTNFTTLFVTDATFSGQLNGLFTVRIIDHATFSGGGNFSGEFELGTAAELTLGRAWTQNVLLGANSTLVLNKPTQFDGDIFNFGAGDTIDVKGVSFGTNTTVHFNDTTDVLTIKDGTHTVHLTVSGSFTADNFVLSDDHHGGVDIGFTTAMMSDHPMDFGLA